MDSADIYAVPLDYHREGLDTQVLAHFGMDDAPAPELSGWNEIVRRRLHPDGEVNIAVVGKYTVLKDAYKSLIEALQHGGVANNAKVNIDWVEADTFEGDPQACAERLEGAHAILVPGGFGERGAEGKIEAARYARERKIPYFGICFGMQMAVIEAARNLAGFPKATSTEFGPADEPVVGLMTEWVQGNERVKREHGGDLGGTMRLGAYASTLAAGSKIAEIYGQTDINERHRHRYEVNINYREAVEEKGGLFFAGMSPDGVLPETVERRDHPWFIGVQYHPEYRSRPFAPHPLFASFIAAALVQSRLV
jgi:CTP synthase